MFKQIDQRTEPLTYELAEEFATMPSCKLERKLSDVRIAWLDAALKDSRFYGPTWAFAWYRGKKIRVNGNHSSNMLCRANGHFPKGLKATVLEFTCDSEEDLAELFSQFDRRDSIRSATDIANAHARIHEELSEVSSTNIKNCNAGIVIAMSEDGTAGRVTEDERARLVHSNTDFVLWADPLIGVRMMRSPGVVGAMYRTFRKNRAAATEFWQLVRDESHPDTDHPSRALAKYLRDCHGLSQSPVAKAKANFTPRARYVKSIHAWNAYRGGYKTDLKYHPNSPVPAVK